MKRKTVLILLVVVAAAGAVAWGLATQRREKPLLLSGAIEARDVEVGSLTGGRVAKILVEEGANVAAGQPIVQFETDLIDLQIQQQRSKIEQAQANLTKALRGPRIEEIGSARAQAENAERERLRQKGLLEKGVTSQQQYDAAATRARRRGKRSCSSSGGIAPRTSRPPGPRSKRKSGNSPTSSARGPSRSSPLRRRA